MAVSILIPTPLRRFAGGADTLLVEAANVHEAIVALTQKHSELQRQLLDKDGEIRSFVNLFLGDRNVRDIASKHKDIRLVDGDVLMIIPAIAGGTTDFTKDEILRYSRHLIMPEVTLAGQRKLKAAKVLCVGAGGLGSPLSLYLAAAGVGTLGIVEFDTVDLTNLHRQILFSNADIGRLKMDAAVERLTQLNPDINVIPHRVRLSSYNALEIFSKYDIVADGTDNFPTRYLVNDACILTGKANVYASIFRFDGQISIFGAAGGPCYRCMFPEPPPPGFVQSCAEGGVLGVLPGIIGTMQALEVLKMILGFGKPLVGRMVLFDAKDFGLRELTIKKQPSCAVCGVSPTITAPIDYQEFCGIRSEEVEVDISGLPIISVENFNSRRLAGDEFALIDVREKHEFEIAHIPGSTSMPLSELPEHISQLDATQTYTITCHRGTRSVEAYHLLKRSGIGQLVILKGGVEEWSKKIDASMLQY